MIVCLASSLLFAFITSTASDDPISKNNTESMVKTVGIINEAIVYFSADSDSKLKCLSCVRTVYEPEKFFAVYHFHYPGQKGKTRTDIDYCVNLNTTVSFKFGFGPCKGRSTSSTAQAYYFDGSSCFVGEFPLLGKKRCLLWIKSGFEKNVSDDCVSQFDKICGAQRYALYDEDQCS